MTELAPVTQLYSKKQPSIDKLPGLLGRMASYIYNSAPYPNEQIALAGAIAFLAAIAGRAFNVSGTGPVSYTHLTLPTKRIV